MQCNDKKDLRSKRGVLNCPRSSSVEVGFEEKLSLKSSWDLNSWALVRLLLKLVMEIQSINKLNARNPGSYLPYDQKTRLSQ